MPAAYAGAGSREPGAGSRERLDDPYQRGQFGILRGFVEGLAQRGLVGGACLFEEFEARSMCASILLCSRERAHQPWVTAVSAGSVAVMAPVSSVPVWSR